MKYFRGEGFKSDREYLQAIIKKGNCYIISGFRYSCQTDCFICNKYEELYNKKIHHFYELVSFCKELLKKEEIQLELFEEYQ